MDDVIYIVGTIVFFVVMVLFAVGCERIIGADDGDAVPGGLHEGPDSPAPLPGGDR
jgi:hypothetical protein